MFEGACPLRIEKKIEIEDTFVIFDTIWSSITSYFIALFVGFHPQVIGYWQGVY